MLAYDQARLHLRGTEQRYTNAIDDLATWPDAYRAPLPSAADDAEITGVAPSVKGTGITSLFTFDEIDGTGGVWPTVWTGAHDVPYEAIPGSDVDGTGSPATTPTRRFVAGHRILYRSDDLTSLLPPGQVQPLALPGQSYTAALTPGLLTAIFGTLVTAATLTEGGYVQLPGETGWWMPSGQVFYSPGRQRPARPGTGHRPGRVLPAPPGRRPVRCGHPGQLRRERPAAGHGDRSGRQHHDRRQRLPRPAARHGHRPQRQPGVGGLRRPRPGHRHRGAGEDGRGRRATC